MKRILLIIALFAAKASFGQKAFDSSFGKPIVWYTVDNPWAMFMGADGPIFTLYESGKLLFWKNKEYQYVLLSKDEKDDLINELNLNDTFFLNQKRVEASFATDQPFYVLMTNLDTLKSFSVYGHMRGDRKNIPKQLTKVYSFITTYENDNAQPWLPEKVEVILSDYSYFPEPSLKWPNSWPDLKSPETVIRQSGVTSIYLAKKYFEDLKRLLSKRKQKQAIEISGKKFYAEYRLPVPNLY
jgi:hypothetical protein